MSSFLGSKAAALHDMMPLDFSAFLPNQLIDMLDLNYTKLTKLELNNKSNSCERMLKCFGISIVLRTKIECTSRVRLGSTVASSKYQPAPHFSVTRFSKKSYEDLFGEVRWSDPPSAPGNTTTKSPEQYQWRLVNDLSPNFNNQQLANDFNPLDFNKG
jgi:hypothetical protein